MAATTTSTSCSTCFNFQSKTVEPRPLTSSSSSSSSHGSPGCGKLDGVAMWFINGVTTAFFASLERCSCIRIATNEDDGEEGNDLPLILNDGNFRHDGGSGTTSKRRTGKGKKGGALLEY